MLTLDEYAKEDGLGLAALVARGEVSAAEVLEAALAAIAATNPRANAVLQRLDDQARAAVEGGLPAGPFSGVPFLVKELVLHAGGVRCEMGSRLAAGFVLPHDTELMRRFRAAGLVLVGTTQTPELGFNPTTEPVAFGPVCNPWDVSRSAGGSSGGSGAAVAAGMVPLAHANDGGGSIRIPASTNGLVGLKPSRDRVPTGPDLADPLCGLACELAVTRSVRDTAALLDAVAGADLGAPSHPVPPERSYLETIAGRPRKLRIAWTATAPSGVASHDECQRAVAAAVTLLEGLGHEVVEGEPALEWEPFLENVLVLWVAFTAALVEALARDLGRRPGSDTLEAVTLACYEQGKRLTGTEVLKAMAYQNHVSRSVAPFFESHDVLLTPTLARPPVPLGELDQNRAGMSPRAWADTVFAYCPFTPLANTTGQPAISLPLHWTADGLPVGVQLVGRFGDEATLLALAAELEQAAPWADRRAPLHAGRAGS